MTKDGAVGMSQSLYPIKNRRCLILKKYLFALLCVLFLTGCSMKEQTYPVNTIYYNLNIHDYYEENITFTLPKDSYSLAQASLNTEFEPIEYMLLVDNFERPIHNNLYSLYGKNIYQMKEAIEVDLDFNYLEKDFVNSNYMNTCFENHSIIDKDDYIEIELSGAFYCLQDKEMVIRVSSDYENEVSNGERLNNVSQWVINSTNVNDVNIYYKVYRNKKAMATSYGTIAKANIDYDTIAVYEFLVIMIVLVAGFFFYKFLYHKMYS